MRERESKKEWESQKDTEKRRETGEREGGEGVRELERKRVRGDEKGKIILDVSR